MRAELSAGIAGDTAGPGRRQLRAAVATFPTSAASLQPWHKPWIMLRKAKQGTISTHPAAISKLSSPMRSCASWQLTPRAVFWRADSGAATGWR